MCYGVVVVDVDVVDVFFNVVDVLVSVGKDASIRVPKGPKVTSAFFNKKVAACH